MKVKLVVLLGGAALLECTRFGRRRSELIREEDKSGGEEDPEVVGKRGSRKEVTTCEKLELERAA